MSDTGVSVPKKVIRIGAPGRVRDETAALGINRAEPTPVPDREISVEAQGATLKVIDIDRLYEAPVGTPSQIVSALELLKQATDNLEHAKQSANPMEADRFVQRVQVVLPKLFTCRAIGDGFGVIINSLHFAFVNLRGTPLNAQQLNVVWRVLRELRVRPVMSLEQGIERVEQLEESGLEVDPPDIGDILEDAQPAENE